jgi:hypothetical protein
MNTSVFEMVHQVLGDAKEKLARDASSGIEKKAAAVKSTPSAKTSGDSKLSNEYLGKLASACDHLSTNLHLIDQKRTPQEKLAEYAEINRALMKRGFEGGDKQHQSTEADSDSVSPSSVSPDDSGTGVGAGNAIPSAPATTSGESMDAGESGEATSGNIPPMSVTPSEKPNQNDAANAFETNLGMMMPTQPDDLLQQAGGTEANGKTAAARALRTIGKAISGADSDLHVKAASAKRVKMLMMKAAQSGIPRSVAAGLIRKLAGDEENPASISAGGDPLLQSEPGVPGVLSQGAEAGSNTPRGSAPTSGEGGGRELISSNEAAMNATKGQAKQQNKGALSELLTEPMMDSGHDRTLQESLDNTSSAGVKISAARELLKKMAASSPDARRKVAALVKRAEGEVAMPPAPQMPEAMPMEEEVPPEAMAAGGEGAGGMDAALAAVLAGVTPEDLAAAEEMLAGEASGGAEAPVVEDGAAPEAGAEGQEKVMQFGGMGGSSSGGGMPTPSPTPMMG